MTVVRPLVPVVCPVVRVSRRACVPLCVPSCGVRPVVRRPSRGRPLGSEVIFQVGAVLSCTFGLTAIAFPEVSRDSLIGTEASHANDHRTLCT